MTNDKCSPSVDRLSIRARPQGQPLMHQAWGKLLFMHWPIDPALLRPLIPEPLEIDTFNDQAWIAVVPFTMWDIRPFPPYLPGIPKLNAMHELNVRTYVHLNGTPGVWFISLDCNSATAVFGARTFYYLPYFNADIELKQDGPRIEYKLTRTDTPPARFESTWEIGEAFSEFGPGTLEFFLTERYCLFSERKRKIYRSCVNHAPWPLRKGIVHSYSSTMLQAAGLPEPTETPLLHYAEAVDVDIWSLQKQLI
jgi:uncharacterized protein